MRNATRVVASMFGVFAGLASIEHGYFETRRGNVRPDGLMIASMGPPCQPEEVWYACEPAMTILPSFLVTGILAILIGLVVVVWAAGFIQKKRGGLILILLSILMLLLGGGIFPPLIGIVGGIAGTRINVPPTGRRAKRPGSLSRILAALWPWPLVVFGSWLIGQWIVGYFFNEFLMELGFAVPLGIVGLILLSVFSASAHDIQSKVETHQADSAGG
jgi:hypothetical protein